MNIKESQSSRKDAQPPFGSDTRQFLKETYQEFHKISWPDRQQVIRETYSVIFLVTVITCMVLAFDFALKKVLFEPLDKVAKVQGGGLGVRTQPLEKQ